MPHLEEGRYLDVSVVLKVYSQSIICFIEGHIRLCMQVNGFSCIYMDVRKREREDKLTNFCIASMGFEKNAISNGLNTYCGYIKCFYFIYSFINKFIPLSCSCLILCQILC